MTCRRISLVTPLFGRDGGVAGHVRESADALRAGGHDVTVICGGAEGDPDRTEAMVVAGLGDPDADSWAPSLETAVRISEADVVHIHDLAEPRIVAVTRALAPTVITAHAYPGCSHNHHYFRPGQECDRAHGLACLANMAFRGCLHARNPLPVPGLYLRTPTRLAAYRMADAVAGFSEAVVRHLAVNGIQATRMAPCTPALRDAGPVLGATPPGRNVLFVGRIVPAKGLEVLLRVMTSVDGMLRVVGDGWKRAAAERLAADLGLSDRVEFTGWLVGADLHRAYREASVVAVPSLWPEPFGLVGIEAMAFGRPVVASMTGGVSEWLLPGVTGLAVAPGDAAALAGALERLLDDAGLRCSMGAAGRATAAERFSEQTHVDSLASLYRRAATRWSDCDAPSAASRHATR